MRIQTVFLSPDEMPRQWYNILSDIKRNPPLGPDGKPVSPDALAPVFPMNLIEQEVSQTRWIDIPEEVLDVYAGWRPTALVRALAFACSQFGLECKIFMVRVSYDQKPYRKSMMQTWGGICIPSPSKETNAGREILKKDPKTPGSLGIAISEAIEAAVTDQSGKTRYSLGSVLNHVMLHQTIIGLEDKKQMKKIGEYPDIVIGCAGGGSNFAGLAFPFVYDKINGKQIEIYPVEPTACPTMTRAPFVYDHGDTARYTPLLPIYSLGHAFVPPPVHAGGLRYHGMSPTVSQLVVERIIEPKAVTQLDADDAGTTFARTVGL